MAIPQQTARKRGRDVGKKWILANVMCAAAIFGEGQLLKAVPASDS